MICTLRRMVQLLLILVLFFSICSCRHDHLKSPETASHMVTVTMHFDYEMPLYQETTYTARSRGTSDKHYDVRYTLRAYPLNSDGKPELVTPRTFRFTESNTDIHDKTVTIELPSDDYVIYAWADYVEPNSIGDLYYNTGDFGSVETLFPDSGDNEYRDTFYGMSSQFYVENENYVCYTTIQMLRPVAQYQVYATDLQEFAEATGQDIAGVDGYDIYVRTRYSGYTPTVFDVTREEAVDAETNVSYSRQIEPVNSSEALVALDYLFVNDETSVTVVLDVVSKSTQQTLYSSGVINIPLKRGCLTIVRGPLLTQSNESPGSFGIDPSFDDTVIIQIE